MTQITRLERIAKAIKQREPKDDHLKQAMVDQSLHHLHKIYGNDENPIEPMTPEEYQAQVAKALKLYTKD